MNRPIIVAAVGCALASDDAIGLHLASSLDDGTDLYDIRFWEDADSLTVAQELLEINQPVFLIDCADMGKHGGSVHCFQPDSLRMLKSTVSCHGFGLAEALELATTLGFSAPVRIVGIQPFDCSPGREMTPEMMACYDRVLLECRSALQQFEKDIQACTNSHSQ